MLRLIIILLATLVASTALAQQQLYDLIHLDDGTVILGTIVGSLRGESVRIITDDGDRLALRIAPRRQNYACPPTIFSEKPSNRPSDVLRFPKLGSIL